jgi:serine protease Do
LPRIVGETPAEIAVDMVVVRDGKEKKIRIKIGTLDEPNLRTAGTETPGPPAFGLRVNNITPEIAAQLGVGTDAGVLVSDVDPGSPAEEAGLQRGDIVVEVNRESVSSVNELSELLGRSKASVLVLVRRGDSTLYIPMKRSE